MNYYHFLKLDVTGKNTILPKKDFINNFSPMSTARAIDRLESKLLFIADIERYIPWYEVRQGGDKPISREFLLPIFHLRFAPEAGKYTSYNQMSHVMRLRMKMGEDHIPARLRYRQNIQVVANEMADTAEEYYQHRGLISGNVRS